jgi:hypothetical protein
MLLLLKKLRPKFTKSTYKIVVTGYYPIVSRLSNPLGVHKLLGLFGIRAPEFLTDPDILPEPVR